MWDEEKEEHIEETIARFEQLQHDAAKIATAMLELQNIEFLGREIEPNDITLDDGILTARYTQKFGCDYEDDSIEIPFEHLVNDDWYEKAAEKVRKKKIEQAKEKERKEQESKRAQEAAEYRRFLELKAKFERNTSND